MLMKVKGLVGLAWGGWGWRGEDGVGLRERMKAAELGGARVTVCWS